MGPICILPQARDAASSTESFIQKEMTDLGKRFAKVAAKPVATPTRSLLVASPPIKSPDKKKIKMGPGDLQPKKLFEDWVITFNI